MPRGSKGSPVCFALIRHVVNFPGHGIAAGSKGMQSGDKMPAIVVQLLARPNFANRTSERLWGESSSAAIRTVVSHT